MDCKFETFGVQDPWFTHLKDKTKRIEGRLNKGRFRDLREGQVIVFDKVAEPTEPKDAILVQIKKIVRYRSFEEYLTQEGLRRTLPAVKTIADGVAVYRRFYSEDDERQYGILSLHVKKVVDLFPPASGEESVTPRG